MSNEDVAEGTNGAGSSNDPKILLQGRRRRLDLLAVIGAASAGAVLILLRSPFYQGSISTMIDGEVIAANWRLTGMSMSQLAGTAPSSAVHLTAGMPDYAFWAILAAIGLTIGAWARTALISAGAMIAAVLAARALAATKTRIASSGFQGEWEIQALAGSTRLSLMLIVMIVVAALCTVQVLAHNRKEREVTGEASQNVFEQIAAATIRGVKDARETS